MKTSEELTEDWNAGKLEQGWYYVRLNTTKIKPMKCTENLPIVCKIGFITLPQLTSLKSGIYGR